MSLTRGSFAHAMATEDVLKEKINELVRAYELLKNRVTVLEEQNVSAAHRMNIICKIDMINRKLHGNIYRETTPDHEMLTMLKRELLLAHKKE